MTDPSATAPEAGQSTAERFFKFFQNEITALQEQMDRLGDTALVGGERKDATDHCLAGITRLSTEVKDASGTIPAYDLRTYSEAVKALQDRLAETQAQHAPKQKFSFKTKKNESAVSLHEAAELAAQKQKSMLSYGVTSGASSSVATPVSHMTPPNEPSTSQETSGTTDSTSTTVTSKSKSHIIIPASTAQAQTTCTLSNLNTCCVDLSLSAVESAPFASLTVNNIDSSLLVCGSIAGPAHVTGVKNSTIVISCRQLRMHECENVDIYLYCTSRPIIEDCIGVGFAEIPLFYTDLLHSAHPTSNQAIGTNMWEHIDDFKWLKSDQSPNWMTISEVDRVPDDMWKEIIPAKSGLGLEKILQITSIKR